MDHHRSFSNPHLFNNTVSPGQLIKFPTITKLTYDGDNPQMSNKTVYRSTNAKLSNKTLSNMGSIGTSTQTGNFRVVQVPPDNYIMKISVMNINQHINNKHRNTEKDGQQRDENQYRNRKYDSKIFLNKQKKNSLLNSINLHRTSQILGNKTIGIPKINDFLQSDSKLKNKTYSLTKLKSNFSISQSRINTSQLYFQIITALALVNGQVIINQSKSFQRIRRAKIEKGNNGYLVKQMIKKRCWWNTTQQLNQANLVWTQKQLRNIQPNKEKQSFFNQIVGQQEGSKVIFQRNIDQALLYYPRILQLFFTELQIQKLIKSNSQANKSKRSYHIYNFLSNKKAKRRITPENTTIYNHIPNHFEITSKKMLYKNIWRYYHEVGKDPYEFIPKTYHLTAFDWQQKSHFIRTQLKKNSNQVHRNIPEAWFLKPGENTNRGKGIQLFKTTNQVLDYIMRNPPKAANKTYILQQYINPLLYDNRKFDIRCYLLCIQVFDIQTFYWYEQGYIRTSSTKFTMNKTSICIHLTNDAVQKQFDNYDKYQSANKLSYIQLDKYIKNQYGYNFLGQIVPKIKQIACDVCKSAIQMGYKNSDNHHFYTEQDLNPTKILSNKSEGDNKRYEGLFFQLFGLDFIISKQGFPFLLQVNTNPCLEVSSNLLSRIIPDVIENTFRIVTDVYMPHKSNNINPNSNNIGNGSVCPDWAQSFITNNRFSLLYRRELGQNKNTKQKQQSYVEQKGKVDEDNKTKVLKIQSLKQKVNSKQGQTNTERNSFFKFGQSNKLSSRYTPQIGKY